MRRTSTRKSGPCHRCIGRANRLCWISGQLAVIDENRKSAQESFRETSAGAAERTPDPAHLCDPLLQVGFLDDDQLSLATPGGQSSLSPLDQQGRRDAVFRRNFGNGERSLRPFEAL